MIFLYCLWWLILNKPKPNLYSEETSIQGPLASVTRLSPEKRFHFNVMLWSSPSVNLSYIKPDGLLEAVEELKQRASLSSTFVMKRLGAS